MLSRPVFRDMFRLTCFVKSEWTEIREKFVSSMVRRFSRIIEGDACTLVYGSFDPEGIVRVELWSSTSEAKLITGINVVRRR